MVGKQLGRYKLVEEIGQGGMAVVYRGVDTTLQREVAVKILHPHLSRKESNRQRFAREARVVATLHHDNIVEIYDFSGGETNGAAGNDAFIVCEYIRGRTLADFIEKMPQIPVEIGVMMIVEICQAVAHAHAANVVHRDIKPENVMIRQDGVLKLMDFGIARVADDSGSTMTGTLMGSPNYMSPEQVNGEELGPRSDLFSIGVLLYRLVTGVLPFDGGNPAAILRAILEGNPAEPDRMNPLVGRDLTRVIQRALAKDPRDRYDGVRQLADDLLSTIVEAGLGSPREELRAYFAEPEGYARKLRERLVVRYARAGEKRAEKKDIAGAMELWSRVLELDPQNKEVRESLDRMGRGQRNKRLAAMSIGVPLLLAGAAFAGWEAWEFVQTLPTPTPVVLATTPLPTPTPATPTPTPTPTATIEKPTPTPTPRPSLTPTAKPATTDVAMLVPSPTDTPIPSHVGLFAFNEFEYYAVMYVDALPYEIPGRKGVLPDAFEVKKDGGLILKPGRHDVTFTPPKSMAGCKPIAGSVTIEGGRTTSEIVIDGRRFTPGELYFRDCKTPILIRTDPAIANGTVVVDDKAAGTVGAQLEVLSGEHRISVSAEGFAENEQTFQIRPKSDVQEFTVRLQKK